MNYRHRSFALVAAMCLAGSGVSRPSMGADAPPEKPAAEKPTVATPPAVKPPGVRSTVIPAAITAPSKEYKAYQKDPKANKVREKCDYFKENASPEATPEAVLKGLEGSVPGGSAVEAYVKWQLLSAITGKFPDELVKRAVSVYRRAPSPGEHPGLRKRDLARAIYGMKKEQVAEAQAKFDERIGQSAAGNAVYLAYRDQLFAMLPSTIDALSAGLEDVGERARGLNANALFDTVAAGLKSWALGDAKPGQAKAMADAVSRLGKQLASEDLHPYTKIGADAKWAAGTPPLDAKKVEELVKFLETSTSSGGLKFKDSK